MGQDDGRVAGGAGAADFTGSELERGGERGPQVHERHLLGKEPVEAQAVGVAECTGQVTGDVPGGQGESVLPFASLFPPAPLFTLHYPSSRNVRGKRVQWISFGRKIHESVFRTVERSR